MAELRVHGMHGVNASHAIINWICDRKGDENVQSLLPAVWHTLETNIREHPHEATERNIMGQLPIHAVLEGFHAVPLSVIEVLIELHPEGLYEQDNSGYIPLLSAVYQRPCNDSFRAVLRNSGFDAPLFQDADGRTPLYISSWVGFDLATVWELIWFNRKCVTVRMDDGIDEEANKTALENMEQNEMLRHQSAKRVLLKMAAYYNHVPNVPNDAIIKMVESHSVCALLAQGLEPGKDNFILHKALAAKCPLVLVKALLTIFPNQVQQEGLDGCLPLHVALQHSLGAPVIRLVAFTYPASMFIADTVTGLLPVEQAILNAANNGSLDSVDVVNSLLRAYPSFLKRIV